MPPAVGPKHRSMLQSRAMSSATPGLSPALPAPPQCLRYSAPTGTAHTNADKAASRNARGRPQRTAAETPRLPEPEEQFPKCCSAAPYPDWNGHPAPEARRLHEQPGRSRPSSPRQ
eukprot:2708692-Alexandrium_andersonii.AAC.1